MKLRRCWRDRHGAVSIEYVLLFVIMLGLIFTVITSFFNGPASVATLHTRYNLGYYSEYCKSIQQEGQSLEWIESNGFDASNNPICTPKINP